MGFSIFMWLLHSLFSVIRTDLTEPATTKPLARSADKTPTESLLELSTIIQENAALVSSYLSSQGLPQPSFSADAVSCQLPDVRILQDARLSLISAARALEDLLLGPEEVLKSIQPNDVVALQAVYRFRIAHALGAREQLPFEQLAQRVRLNPVDLKRLLRLAMTRHVFREPIPGIVAHTAASRLLADDERAEEWAGIMTEERFPAAARAVDALQLYGQSRDVNQCGFSLANATKAGLYQEISASPRRRDRWTKAMSAIAKEVDFDFVLASFDWAALPHAATVVDVGGGHGDVSLGLATRLKDADICFIVQDRPETIRSNLEALTASAGRVAFEAHDFFAEQPRHGADVYYFRNIFHNWPDAQCMRILQAHIAAMTPASRLVIDDYALHEPLTVGAYAERQIRSMDVTMLIYFGSRERTVGEWVKLLAQADPRFVLRRISRHPEQMSTIFEVGWEGGLIGESD